MEENNFLKSSTISNQPCFQVNESIVSPIQVPEATYYTTFWTLLSSEQFWSLQELQNQMIQRLGPHGLDRLGLFASGCSIIEHSEQTLTQPRASVGNTADRPLYDVESIIRLISFHCLGFHAGFKEIITWMKKAWESVQFITACVQVGL